LATLLGTTLLAPNVAQAAPAAERWQELTWVYVSPLLLAAPLAQREFTQLRATWQWSAGAGYTLMPLDHLWIIAGGSFEHMVLNPSSSVVSGSQFRILPEARVGGGWDQTFIYGLFGLGLGLNHVESTDDENNAYKRTDGGFNLQLGIGTMYQVWDALSVGGELDFDLGWYRESKCEGDCGYAVHTLGIKAMVGYQF
jgi:hypothetical protein